MSWDSYIDNMMGHANLNGTCQIDKACIIGTNGAQWTTDAHPNAFRLSDDERKKIASEVALGANSNFGATGIRAGGVKYQFLRYEDGVVLGKKKDEGAITMQTSKTAIVIAHTIEGGQQGSTNKAVGVIAEYLTSLGM